MSFKLHWGGLRTRHALLLVAIVWVALFAALLARIGSGPSTPATFTAGAASLTSPASASLSAPATPETLPPPVVVARASQAVAADPHTTPAEVAEGVAAPHAPAVTAARQLIFDGQSLNYSPMDRQGRTYPEQLLALLGPRVGLDGVVAISGTTYAQRSDSVASRVDALLPRAHRSMVLDLAGQSDLLNKMSATDMYNTVTAYADARRRAGATFVVEFTVIPSTLYTPEENEQRLAFNKMLLRNQGHHFAAVIDIAHRAEFADPANRTYLADGLHPTEAGAAVIAEMAKPFVRALLGI